MAARRASLSEIRGFFAKQMAAASGSADPRLERVFELVPREAFLPPGPWKVSLGQSYIETPSADPIYLYQNSLVALDASRRLNNGEPFLHAAWIGAVAPKMGETVTQIGTGHGYYTAILATLVEPGGRVAGFEIDPDFAAAAQANLAPFENVCVTCADASTAPLPQSDLIYVNAGVTAPPLGWVQALKPGGRMIFPWRPAEAVGLAVIVSRQEAGFSARPLMPVWFTPCIGADRVPAGYQPPHFGRAMAVRSLWPTAARAPDATAVAVYDDLWFSSEPLG